MYYASLILGRFLPFVRRLWEFAKAIIRNLSTIVNIAIQVVWIFGIGLRSKGGIEDGTLALCVVLEVR